MESIIASIAISGIVILVIRIIILLFHLKKQ